MYPQALTPKDFEKEQPTYKDKVEDAYELLSKGCTPYQAARYIDYYTSERTDLFIENLALNMDELEGLEPEERWNQLKDLWLRIHVETELEYLRKPKQTHSVEFPWL
jgi:hypothetical protein